MYDLYVLDLSAWVRQSYSFQLIWELVYNSFGFLQKSYWINNFETLRQPHSPIIGQPSSQYLPNYPSQVGPTSAGIQRLSHPTLTADPRGSVCCPPPPPNQTVIRTPATCGAGRYVHKCVSFFFLIMLIEGSKLWLIQSQKPQTFWFCNLEIHISHAVAISSLYNNTRAIIIIDKCDRGQRLFQSFLNFFSLFALESQHEWMTFSPVLANSGSYFCFMK